MPKLFCQREGWLRWNKWRGGVWVCFWDALEGGWGGSHDYCEYAVVLMIESWISRFLIKIGEISLNKVSLDHLDFSEQTINRSVQILNRLFLIETHDSCFRLGLSLIVGVGVSEVLRKWEDHAMTWLIRKEFRVIASWPHYFWFAENERKWRNSCIQKLSFRKVCIQTWNESDRFCIKPLFSLTRL